MGGVGYGARGNNAYLTKLGGHDINDSIGEVEKEDEPESPWRPPADPTTKLKNAMSTATTSAADEVRDYFYPKADFEKDAPYGSLAPLRTELFGSSEKPPPSSLDIGTLGQTDYVDPLIKGIDAAAPRALQPANTSGLSEFGSASPGAKSGQSPFLSEASPAEDLLKTQGAAALVDPLRDYGAKY